MVGERSTTTSSRAVASPLGERGRVDLYPMMTVAELKTKAISANIEVVQGGARVGRKAVEFAFDEEREEVPRESARPTRVFLRSKPCTLVLGRPKWLDCIQV